jgi:hypothetical protein
MYGRHKPLVGADGPSLAKSVTNYLLLVRLELTLTQGRTHKQLLRPEIVGTLNYGPTVLMSRFQSAQVGVAAALQV